MRFSFFVPVILFAVVSPVALAEDKPPSAAPTTRVAVDFLPIVRAESESVNDYATGLLHGLMASGHVPGLALSIVKRDQPMVQKGFGLGADGMPVNANTVFDAGSLGEVIAAIGAAQLIEQNRLNPASDLGNAVGDGSLTRTSAADLLTQKKHRTGALGRVVATIARQDFPSYAREHIFLPLDMAASRIENDGSLTTTAADMSKLMLALVNQGAFKEARILQPQSLADIGQIKFTLAPGLDGWGYGFAVANRNGWQSWVRDGRGSRSETRLVIVPEAQTAYFAITGRDASAAFWQAFDYSLFDRLFPPRKNIQAIAAPANAPPPGSKVDFGTYLRVTSEPELTVDRGPLRVFARGDGRLVLSGAARGVLLPVAGGLWQNSTLGLEAKFSGSYLSVNGVLYAAVPLWRTPFLYAGIGLVVALAALISGLVAWRLPTRRRLAMRGAIGLSVLSLVALAAGVVIWLLPTGP